MREECRVRAGVSVMVTAKVRARVRNTVMAGIGVGGWRRVGVVAILWLRYELRLL